MCNQLTSGARRIRLIVGMSNVLQSVPGMRFWCVETQTVSGESSFRSCVVLVRFSALLSRICVVAFMCEKYLLSCEEVSYRARP